jgi:hypothetical protein
MRSRLLDRGLAVTIALALAGNTTFISGAAAGFVAAATQNKSESSWEEKLRAIPQAERIKEYMRLLSAEPHHIGSAAGKRNAEWMRDQMKKNWVEAAEQVKVISRALDAMSSQIESAARKLPGQFDSQKLQ